MAEQRRFRDVSPRHLATRVRVFQDSRRYLQKDVERTGKREKMEGYGSEGGRKRAEVAMLVRFD